jgi:hypothetical protein
MGVPVYYLRLSKRSLTEAERDEQIRRYWASRGFEVQRKPRKPGIRSVLSEEEREKRRAQYQKRSKAIHDQAAIRTDYLIKAWLNHPRKRID